MNWQIPNLIAQTDATANLRERVEATTLPGTQVPDSALVREGGSNFLQSEYWFPQQASDVAGAVDYLYMGTFWISLVFFVAIVITMVYFCVKYRRVGNEINPLPSPSHNTGIEILWSVLPSILLVWIFYEGATGYFEMKTARDDAEEINVMASRYNWLFTYPDGDSSSELHLVRDRPTRLVMQSKDVLHSLYVPAFRQKQDVVPGRYTYLDILPTQTGQFRLACAEYCGEGHSTMRTMAEVHRTKEDRKANTQWIKAEHAPWQNGERTYKIQCSGCHKIDGTAATGPALNLLWGKGEEELIDGTKVKVDAQYIQDSIWYPEKHVVAGYGPVSKMNSFKGQLKEEDINDIVAFLKYLNDPSSVSSEAGAEEPAAGENASAAEEPQADSVDSGSTAPAETEQ
jgi:cytochrome c oxidase subunit 2